jgi:hypothetical protein
LFCSVSTSDSNILRRPQSFRLWFCFVKGEISLPEDSVYQQIYS